jgi:hypothetical protein
MAKIKDKYPRIRFILDQIKKKFGQDYNLKNDDDILIYALATLMHADIPIFEYQSDGIRITSTPTISQIKLK